MEKAAAHFFFDDYYFERYWRMPSRVPMTVFDAGAALTPDFSVYSAWPRAAQIWNVYRSRWFGALWQSYGVNVIPTVTWGAPNTYDFCFEGIAPSNLVAIAFAGCGRSREERDLFRAGYIEMISRLKPQLVLCYGKMPEELQGIAPVKCYDTRWDAIRKGLRNEP